MISLPRKYQLTRRVLQGLYRERKFFLATSLIIPALVFVALSLVLVHHPGPHGIGSAQSLIGTFAGIYCALSGCFVGVVAVAFFVDTLSSTCRDRTFASSPLVGEPPYWVKREDRPPRA